MLRHVNKYLMFVWNKFIKEQKKIQVKQFYKV